MTASAAATRRSSTRNSGNGNISNESVNPGSDPTPTATTAAKPMDFSPPAKGFFTTTTTSSRGRPRTQHSTSNPRASSKSNQADDDSGLAKSPSLVGPMRRKVSESYGDKSALTGRNFSSASSNANSKDSYSSTNARPIPGANRTRSPSNPRSVSSRSLGGIGSFASRGFGNANHEDPSNADLSTSFGTAAEALSLSSSIPTGASAPTTGRSFPGSNPLLSSSFKESHSGNNKKSPMGHSHFGQECFGPGTGDLKNPPPDSMLSSSATAENGSKSSVGIKDKDGESKSGGIHRCESCNKLYRHPSCLVKHRWEHTVYWKEASKFLMSKHQQVQLLEAAAILVGMDSNSGSLPEEKALWPAAISPPSSGLLGSEKINYEKLRSMPRQTTEIERNERAFSPMTNDGTGTERSMSVVNDSFEEDEEIQDDGEGRHYVDDEDDVENQEDDDDDDEDDDEEEGDGDDEENQSVSTSFNNQRSQSRSINYHASNSRSSGNGNKISSSASKSLTLSPINRMSDLRIATSPTNKSHLPKAHLDRDQSRRPNHRQHYQSYSSTTIPSLSSSTSSKNVPRGQTATHGVPTGNASEDRKRRIRRNASAEDGESEETSSNTTGTEGNGTDATIDSPPDTTQDQTSFDETVDEEEKQKLKFERVERESAGDVVAGMDMD